MQGKGGNGRGRMNERAFSKPDKRSLYINLWISQEEGEEKGGVDGWMDEGQSRNSPQMIPSLPFQKRMSSVFCRG